MKKILLRGPSLTQSGYGVHCRQVASWLLSKSDIEVKFQALPWGETPWILDRNSHGGIIGKIMDNTVEVTPGEKGRYDVTLQLQLPNEWDSSLGKKNVGLTAGVETDICNPEWVNACNKMDVVVVPSNHSAECLRRSGTLTKPLHVIPEAYCSEIPKVTQQQVDALPRFSTNFNFLIFGQVTGDNPYNDRKNIFFTLKWLFEAFKGDKEVGIVIKTNVGRNTRIDKRRTMDLMRSLVKECRRGEIFPKIHLIHGDLSDDTVSALYRHPQIKALVTATRGEGFGLPILEAAASGLPVIATDWSGHIDFLKEGKFIQLNYNVKPVHTSRVDGRIFLPNSRWAEVIEEDFKKKTKKFRDSPSEPTRWANDLASVVKEKYSLEAIYNHYDNVLGNLLC